MEIKLPPQIFPIKYSPVGAAGLWIKKKATHAP
jgi:hypothetical protein